MARPPAILLLGPTASGKTPRGAHRASAGLWGRRCVHFDFGAHLRAVGASAGPVDGLTPADVAVVAESLRTGSLLENEHFHIARHLLLRFAQREAAGGATIVLNGLPRHVGQAASVDALVAIDAVLCLDCPAEVVFERARTNRGGDRAQRVDDDVAALRRRLKTFVERTAPLVAHYHERRARICHVPVDPDTTPARIAASLTVPRPAAVR